MIAHGELDEQQFARRCWKHGWHGRLYVCHRYNRALRAKLREEGAQLAAQMHDPAWKARNIANGVPPIVLEIFDWMANG